MKKAAIDIPADYLGGMVLGRDYISLPDDVVTPAPGWNDGVSNLNQEPRSSQIRDENAYYVSSS